MGPMQFLPGTWSRYASDGDGDGKADPQNVYDAALAAARYLCSGGLNLRDQSQVLTAILRYNNSMAYAQNVMGWAAAYATGVAPVDLPPIVGPAPAIGDVHLENPEGLGPGMPFNATGLPATDPLSQMPLINFGNTETAGQLATGPLPGPAGMLPQQSPCAGDLHGLADRSSGGRPGTRRRVCRGSLAVATALADAVTAGSGRRARSRTRGSGPAACDARCTPGPGQLT